MAHPLERWLKTSGDGPSATLDLDDWNGLLNTVGPLLTQLIQKGADFDAVSAVAIGVLLERINGVLGPAYDQVAARGAQIEALYALLNGQGVSAGSVITDASHRFLTDAQIADLQARVTAADLVAAVAGLKGTVDAAHDTLGELAALVDQANAGVTANTAAIGSRLRGDAAGGYGAGVLAQFLANLKLNTTGAVSSRNRLINSSFAINQRAAVPASTNYAAGAYVMDRWKAGSGGCTLSWAAGANGDVTATITAGTLVQIVEGGLYLPEGGAFVLSWSGTATARVWQGSAAGAYAASPLAVAGLTAGTNTAIEFSTGTVTLAQFEPGAAATAFERRDDELRRCQRYYETGAYQMVGNGYTSTAYVATPIFYKVSKRTSNPAVSATIPSYSNLSGLTVASISADMAVLSSQVSSAGNGTGSGVYVITAEL